jgi:DNA-directed RNA polymerase subunit K/omega
MSDVSEDEIEYEEEESEEEEEEEEVDAVDDTFQEEYEGSSVVSEEEEPRLFDSSANDDFIARMHPQEKCVSYEDVKTMVAVTRDANECVVDALHHTNPIMTKFEHARILGLRAKQLDDGCPPLIETDLVDGALIAREEMRQKKIPFFIRRPYNGGHEYWRVEDLENFN